MKYYKFSGTKHAHDIEYRRARCFNEWCQAKSEGKMELANKLENLLDKLDELRGYLHEGVCEIPTHLYGLALDCVGWATAMRK